MPQKTLVSYRKGIASPTSKKRRGCSIITQPVFSVSVVQAATLPRRSKLKSKISETSARTILAAVGVTALARGPAGALRRKVVRLPSFAPLSIGYRIVTTRSLNKHALLPVLPPGVRVLAPPDRNWPVETEGNSAD